MRLRSFSKVVIAYNDDETYESSVDVRFKEDDSIVYKRTASYGTVSLPSNIGRFLGLFLGISVLSVIETIYFFTLRLMSDIWGFKKMLKAFVIFK